MKMEKTDKPDFARIYITTCAQTTASNVYDKYVTPLQSRIAELEKELRDRDKRIEVFENYLERNGIPKI